MLGAIRKFSKSIYAKILLGIVIIPFVFWGMGSSFKSGSKNVVVKIDKDKFSIQDFSNFVQSYGPVNQENASAIIDNLLTIFIENKLIEKEFENFELKLTNVSLGNLIKEQKEFKRDGIFSRTEYENFLLTNNLNVVMFESNLSRQEKRNQLVDLIGSGVIPSKFMVNATYNEINQKRNIELINLNKIFKKDFNFTENEIKSFYEKNKNLYKEIYKTVKILELNPTNLTGMDIFNDLFFKKIDEIDDLIMQGKKLDDIVNDYNLKKASTYTINKSGKNINSVEVDGIQKNLIKDIFSILDSDPIVIVEKKDKFFIIEILKSESLEQSLKNEDIKKKVITSLKNEKKRKVISEIITKINQKSFDKSDFDKISKEKNEEIKKILLNNREDFTILKKELVNQIYLHPEKNIIVVHDISFKEIYLIYIDEIHNVSIDEASEDYEKYMRLSKIKIANELFNTYDNHIRNKYKIDINYKALKTVKSYFN